MNQDASSVCMAGVQIGIKPDQIAKFCLVGLILKGANFGVLMISLETFSDTYIGASVFG